MRSFLSALRQGFVFAGLTFLFSAPGITMSYECPETLSHADASEIGKGKHPQLELDGSKQFKFPDPNNRVVKNTYSQLTLDSQNDKGCIYSYTGKLTHHSYTFTTEFK